MKILIALLAVLAAAGCSSKPCVDGERTSGGNWYGTSTVRTAYDPCPQKCCSPEWSRGCACSARCPCTEHHKH